MAKIKVKGMAGRFILGMSGRLVEDAEIVETLPGVIVAAMEAGKGEPTEITLDAGAVSLAFEQIAAENDAPQSDKAPYAGDGGSDEPQGLPGGGELTSGS